MINNRPLLLHLCISTMRKRRGILLVLLVLLVLFIDRHQPDTEVGFTHSRFDVIHTMYKTTMGFLAIDIF